MNIRSPGPPVPDPEAEPEPEPELGPPDPLRRSIAVSADCARAVDIACRQSLGRDTRAQVAPATTVDPLRDSTTRGGCACRCSLLIVEKKYKKKKKKKKTVR
jgi:serine/threonine protein kinase HipA of HipAB toxin-antitoxin module